MEENKVKMLGSEAVVKSLEDIFKFHGHIMNNVTGSTTVLFKKLAAYFEVPFHEANKFSTSDIGKELLDKEKAPDASTFQNAINMLGISFTEAWENTIENIDICYKLDGIVFGTSVHASGMIMTKDIIDLPKNSQDVINFNGVSLEAYGYTKNDLLSLDTLDPIRDIYGMDVDWEDTSDPKVWDTICSGDLDFVFQLAGAVPKDMCKKGQPRNIERLAEINAINRPGPLNAKPEPLNQVWIKIQNGEYKFTGSGKVIADILHKRFGKDHTGLLVFQEDLMFLATDAAGFTMAEADILRKGTSKKKEEVLAPLKEKFVSGWNRHQSTVFIEGGFRYPHDYIFILTDGSEITAYDLYLKLQEENEVEIQGNPLIYTVNKDMISIETNGNAEEIWENIREFSKYSFNKSHSVAYSLISYQTAKLLTYNREEFYEWMMNKGNAKRQKEAIEACKKLGYTIKFPSLNARNEASDGYKIERGTIFAPVAAQAEGECIGEFIFSDKERIEKLNFIIRGVLDRYTPDRKALTDLVKALPKDKNYIPTFPECSSLFTFLEYGDVFGLWKYSDNGDYYTVTIKKPRSESVINIFKPGDGVPDEIIEFNIKQDIKHFKVPKPGTLSDYPSLNEVRIINLIKKTRDSFLHRNGIDITNPDNAKLIRKGVQDEMDKVFQDPRFKGKVQNVEEEEMIVFFKKAIYNQESKYAKIFLEFNDGEHMFYCRDKALIEKVMAANKNTIMRVVLKVDRYVSKAFDPVILFKIGDILDKKVV